MKIVYSEGPAQYSDYTFNYAVYAIPTESEIEEAYSRGFLPYSGNLQLKEKYFYLCRSLRIDLDHFSLGSENRRVQRKMEGEEIFHHILQPIEVLENEKYLQFCQTYAKERFSGNSMPLDRMKYVFNWHKKLVVHEFRTKNTLLGLILCLEDQKTRHYWFSFYSLSTSNKINLGKYLMTEMILLSKKEGFTHIYLGTCYGKASLYKARDYKGIEYFDGTGWNSNLKSLKNLCSIDELNETTLTDRLKIINFGLE